MVNAEMESEENDDADDMLKIYLRFLEIDFLLHFCITYIFFFSIAI